MTAMNEYEVYYWDAQEIILMFTPKAFRSLLIIEDFDFELYKRLINLTQEYIDMEEYLYCAAIKKYLIKYEKNYLNIINNKKEPI